MIYTLKNKNFTVNIDSFGAQIKNVLFKGEEKLWQNPDGKWGNSCPVLFPVCGHVDLVYNQTKYEMPPHGFAKKMEFSVVKQTDTSITFMIKADEQTKAVYPFDFEFYITYKINTDTLVFDYVVKNLGKNALPFSIGGHESFATDADISEYKAVFSKKEELINLVNDVDGYLINQTELIANGNTLILDEKYFKDSISLIFSGLKSKSVKLYKKDKPIAQINYKDFNTLLFWKEPNSNFICIEPWLNVPDDYYNMQDVIEDKFGFIWVKQGKKKKINQSIKYY